MKFFYAVLFVSTSLVAYAQEQINESFAFQSDPSKDYSIVIPSAYQEGEPIAAFLALHPFNTNRWNAETWCDELADFAEANDVILVCPDGGADGRIDDPIDTAFTSLLLDSAFIWYDIDPARLYATGFSWGGKTTYTYGLNHIDKFAGLLPIGAAINSAEVNGIADQADGVPIYIVHGSQDSPSVRFTPIRDAMINNGACVETNLLQGVGHTIDFANQVEILSNAYAYLQDNACTTTSTEDLPATSKDILPYNTLTKGVTISLDLQDGTSWTIYSAAGQKVLDGQSSQMIITLDNGYYVIKSGIRSQIFNVF